VNHSRRGRRIWLLFFALGVASVAAAPIGLRGRPPDPPSPERFTGLTLEDMAARIPGLSGYVGSISTQLGNFMLATGVLLSALAAGPFRRGERWAWFVAWVAPLLLLIQLVNSRRGLGWQADAGLLVATVAGLLWSFPSFFSDRRRAD
jgi:hypothetical protein